MKYMLLVYLEEQALSESEREKCYVESARLTRELDAQGKYLSAGPLHPVAMATTVRVRNGKRLVTDGPFAETREQLGGYYLIDARDLDEAMSIAERVPVAKVGTIEIRPVLEIEGLPGQ
ncbi:MAG TPA: YciI family protein [Pyrinomonadaceae bacterium]|nr:YciI family protein [Pyrinomonadaceae bacterium]